MSVGFPTVGGAGRAERPLSAVPDPKPPNESSFAERFDAAIESGPPPEVRAEVQAALQDWRTFSSAAGRRNAGLALLPHK